METYDKIINQLFYPTLYPQPNVHTCQTFFNRIKTEFLNLRVRSVINGYQNRFGLIENFSNKAKISRFSTNKTFLFLEQIKQKTYLAKLSFFHRISKVEKAAKIG